MLEESPKGSPFFGIRLFAECDTDRYNREKA
jgi:hypothetical protein